MTRHLQVRLEADEHEAFLAKAKRAGMSQQGAGRQAIVRWEEPAPDAELFSDLTEPEAATLSWILEFLRDDSIPDPWGMRRVLLAKGKEWASSKRKG